MADQQDTTAGKPAKKSRFITQVVLYTHLNAAAHKVGEVVEMTEDEARHLLNLRHVRRENAQPDAQAMSNEFAFRKDPSIVGAPLPDAPRFDKTIGDGGVSEPTTPKAL